MEGRRAQDENGRVDEERTQQRHRGVDRGEADRAPLARVAALVGPRLHHARVQVQVVRHHRGAQDADGDVQHARIGHDLGLRQQSTKDALQRRMRNRQFVGEASTDHHDQPAHDALQHAESAALQHEHHQHVERGQQHARHQRQSEQQLQRDRRSDHLGQVARGDGHLAQHPLRDAGCARSTVATCLRQIAFRHDAQLQREVLQQDRHQVGHQDHHQQRVAEQRAASEIGGPVAGIHVAHRHHGAGTGKRQQRAPETALRRHRHAGMHLGQRATTGCMAPPVQARV